MHGTMNLKHIFIFELFSIDLMWCWMSQLQRYVWLKYWLYLGFLSGRWRCDCDPQGYVKFVVCSVVSSFPPAILYLPAFCTSEKFLHTNQTNIDITWLTTTQNRRRCLFYRHIAVVLFSLSIFSDKILRGLSELSRQSGRRRSAKLVPTFADRGVSRGQHNGSHGR